MKVKQYGFDFLSKDEPVIAIKILVVKILISPLNNSHLIILLNQK